MKHLKENKPAAIAAALLAVLLFCAYTDFPVGWSVKPNASSGLIWTCTNTTTGEGRWSNAVSQVSQLASNFFAMGISNIVAGTNVIIYTNAGTIVVNATSSGGGAGGGGTNYPPVLRMGTNVTIGSGVRQNLTIQTNASFQVVFTGTPLNGENVIIGVSNISSSVIYMTNTAGIFDPTVASNVTTFAIAGTSLKFFEFVSSTNLNAGVARWELRDALGKEVELAVAGQWLSMLTNSAATIITVSNSYSSACTVISGAGNGNTNYLITVSTNSVNHFYMGSSNVLIYAVVGAQQGTAVYWNAYVTNLSANTWGIKFASDTNRWLFSGVYGTNAPSVLTNNTKLQISGVSDGTNITVGYTYYAPGL